MKSVTSKNSNASTLSSATLCVGVGGSTRNASVTVCTDDSILGVCEQERITRVRAAGFNSTGLPDEALDELLHRSGRQRSDVAAYAFAESVPAYSGTAAVHLDHHFAHACSAFLPSPYDSATIVVCDDDSPQISVWDGHGTDITQIEWPWHGSGFAEVYSRCAEALGFARGHEQRMEVLARVDPTQRAERVHHLMDLDDIDRVRLAPGWQIQIASWLGNGDWRPRASLAAALQARIGDLFIEFLTEVRRRAPVRRHLCAGGSFFRNSHFNSRTRLCSGFDDVFIPIDPGNAGLSVGTALHVSGQARQPITPFLGPSYTSEEIKATLDNCKLTYSWTSETDAIAIAAEALERGRLVAWFDGAMEWGPRALGARSIFASPFSPYVLDNLNHFLKLRDPWHGYPLSGLEAAVNDYFDGPKTAPFMECDFVPRDRERFRHVLPGLNASVRVQTVGSEAPPRFRALLQAFGENGGIPILVNTSFNGFREPIVCSPRDAVRVFFGTGIDVLVLGPFVISK